LDLWTGTFVLIFPLLVIPASPQPGEQKTEECPAAAIARLGDTKTIVRINIE
jgi:hypothetical protein